MCVQDKHKNAPSLEPSSRVDNASINYMHAAGQLVSGRATFLRLQGRKNVAGPETIGQLH